MNIVPQLIQATPEMTAALVDSDAVEAWHLAVRTVGATADQITEVVDRVDVGIDIDADEPDTERLEWDLSSVAARHPACPQPVVAHALACRLADPVLGVAPGSPPEDDLFTTVLASPNVTGRQLMRVCDALMVKKAEHNAGGDDGGGGLVGSWVDAWRNRRKQARRTPEARVRVASDLVAHPNAPAELLEPVVAGLLDGVIGTSNIGARRLAYTLAAHPNLTGDLAEMLVASDHEGIAEGGASASVLGPARAADLVTSGGPRGVGAVRNPSLPDGLIAAVARRLVDDGHWVGVELLANPSTPEDVLSAVCDAAAPDGSAPSTRRGVRLRLQRNPSAPVGLLRRYNAFAAAAAHPDADTGTLRWAFDSVVSGRDLDDVVHSAAHHPNSDPGLLVRLVEHAADGRADPGWVGGITYAALLHRNADASVAAAAAEHHLNRLGYDRPLDMRVVQVVQRLTGMGADLLAWDALAEG